MVRTKEQIREYHKKYREKNREKLKEQKKAYYPKYKEANREKILAQNKKYYEANREKIRLSRKKYYEENPDKERLRHKKYRKKHPEKFNKYQKIYRWKSRGLIVDDEDEYESIYYLVMSTEECEGCGCKLTENNPRTSTSRVLDHCHITGKFRAVLCHSCNVKQPRQPKQIKNNINIDEII